MTGRGAARIGLALTAVGLLGIAALLLLAYRPALAAIARPDPARFAAADVARGAELARLGNCNTCHSAAHGRAFAGGVPLKTPFGTIYGTNITPDVATGIGGWSEAAFARALHDGVARDGRQLYPAFPYDHFTMLRPADVHALYAYLMTREAVQATAPANRLIPPLGFRPVIAGWKLLFFRHRAAAPDRGAYLADALAHCGACHTPHNVLGAEEWRRPYAGGMAEGWYAPPLDRTSPAVRRWDADRLFAYLRTGLSTTHAAATGPMGPVTRNLSGVPDADVLAMARTIAASMGQARASHAEPALPDRAAEAAAAFPTGATLFAGACTPCHAEGAHMMVEGRPPLPLGSPLHEDGPRDMIAIILAGLQPPVGRAGPYMPSYAGAFTDRQVAQIVGYLRARHDTGPAWPRLERAVADARKEVAP